MVETIRELKSKLNGSDHVTPARIQRYLERSDDELSANDVWLLMPPEITAKFVSNSGNLKEKKIKKFLRSLDALLVDHTPMDLLKMDEDCVRKDGSVNEVLLDKILKEGTGI